MPFHIPALLGWRSSVEFSTVPDCMLPSRNWTISKATLLVSSVMVDACMKQPTPRIFPFDVHSSTHYIGILRQPSTKIHNGWERFNHRSMTGPLYLFAYRKLGHKVIYMRWIPQMLICRRWRQDGCEDTYTCCEQYNLRHAVLRK